MILLTYEQLNEFVYVSENMDENPIVEQSILQAQDKYIKPVLGREFYNAVIAAPESYTALLPYIRKALAYYAGVEIYGMNGVHLTASGVTTFSAEWASRAPMEAINEKKGLLNNSGQVAIEDLRYYLNQNESLYPLYKAWRQQQLSSTMGVWA